MVNKSRKGGIMKEVAIIADSVATVPPEVAQKYDILEAPFHN